MRDKLSKLKKIISRMGSIAIAFSGGMDSTFLLKVSSTVLPKNRMLAVTASSETYPARELLFAKSIARHLGIKHKIIKTSELKDKRFVSNPVNRCYFCKKELFSRLKEVALESKLNFVVDASNVSDKDDFRPGSQAKKELGVRSPLEEAGLTKEEIRILSKQSGLKTWDKPQLACLASRIPYGTKITPGLLERINEAESYLRRLGFKQVRLRHYNGTCRIEVLAEDILRLMNKRKLIVGRLKRWGYKYVTADLEGYRPGSMNL